MSATLWGMVTKPRKAANDELFAQFDDGAMTASEIRKARASDVLPPLPEPSPTRRVPRQRKKRNR